MTTHKAVISEEIQQDYLRRLKTPYFKISNYLFIFFNSDFHMQFLVY